MLRNYLKIALRNLRKHKLYSAINISGLALGLACCILIGLYVRHEFSFDRFHEKADQIYRLNMSYVGGLSDTRKLAAGAPFPLGNALQETFPEVKHVVRFADRTVNIPLNGELITEKVLFTDPQVFDLFSFPLASGDPAMALARPNVAVLSSETARKYFGDKNPVGKHLSLYFDDDTLEVVVSGVTEEVPTTSSIQFDLLLPIANLSDVLSGWLQRYMLERWRSPAIDTFVQIASPEQADRLEPKLAAFVSQHVEENTEIAFHLQPLTAIHFEQEAIGPLHEPGNPLYAYGLAGLGLLVLLIACINFTTLSLGSSAGRAREVAIRKVAGARLGQVRFQFWGEALLISSLALVLAVILAQLFLPIFNRLTDKSLEFAVLAEPRYVLALIGLAIVTALLAGSYPALVLSRFNPISVLKNRLVFGRQGWLMKGLIVFQFTVSFALVISLLVISQQLQFMAETDLGFDKEHLVTLSISSSEEGERIYERYRNLAASNPGVIALTSSYTTFGWTTPTQLTTDDGEVSGYLNPVDLNFLEVMGIELLSGRDFSESRDAGAENIALVNKALVEAMGWEEPVGKTLPITGSFSFIEATVIGVIENYHYESLHTPIKPLMLVPRATVGGGVTAILVRIRPDNISETLGRLEETWEKVAPNKPFEYTFIDEVIDQKYRAEQRWQAIVRYTSIFALFIACFGLFGIAKLSIVRRTKEIGIRKVLGATATNIAVRLSAGFLKLVGIAFIFAVPVAYIAMQWWLKDFAYRVELEPDVFLLAGLGGLMIALIAVGYQSIKAALANPVDSLRYE